MLSEYLKKLTAYNLWANTRMAGFIVEAGTAVASLEQQSSFPSVQKTFYHIWDAEQIWLNRLNGTSLHNWPTKEFEGSLEAACTQWLGTSAAINAYCQLLNENATSAIVNYSNLKGVQFKNSITEIITHCMNHSTFHRGQLVTLMRGAGFTNVGSTDLITFYRS